MGVSFHSSLSFSLSDFRARSTDELPSLLNFFTNIQKSTSYRSFLVFRFLRSVFRVSPILGTHCRLCSLSNTNVNLPQFTVEAYIPPWRNHSCSTYHARAMTSRGRPYSLSPVQPCADIIFNMSLCGKYYRNGENIL